MNLQESHARLLGEWYNIKARILSSIKAAGKKKISIKINFLISLSQHPQPYQLGSRTQRRALVLSHTAVFGCPCLAFAPPRLKGLLLLLPLLLVAEPSSPLCRVRKNSTHLRLSCHMQPQGIEDIPAVSPFPEGLCACIPAPLPLQAHLCMQPPTTFCPRGSTVGPLLCSHSWSAQKSKFWLCFYELAVHPAGTPPWATPTTGRACSLPFHFRPGRRRRVSFKYNAAKHSLSDCRCSWSSWLSPGTSKLRTKGLRSSYAKRQFLWQLRAALVFLPWLVWQQGG